MVRIGQFLPAFVGRYPFAVDIAPGIPAQRAIKIIVKPYLLLPVIGRDFNS